MSYPKRLAALLALLFVIGSQTATAQSYLQAAACYLSGSNTACLKTVNVASGGTGAATLASNGVLYGNGTSAVQALAVNSTGTNNFLTQSSSAAPAWAALVSGDIPNLAASKITSGTLAVAQGGTNLASGTSGGVLAYTASGTLASSAALAANGVVYGGGAGVVPAATTSGTTSQVLIGGSPPSFGNVPAAALPAATSSAAGSVSYEDSGSFTANFNVGMNTSTNNTTVRYSRVGKVVSLIVPILNVTANATSVVWQTGATGAGGIPAGLVPSTGTITMFFVQAFNNNVDDTVPSFLIINTNGVMQINRTVTWTNTTTHCGFETFAVSYTVQ